MIVEEFFQKSRDFVLTLFNPKTNIILLSGDVHHGEIMVDPCTKFINGYEMREFTSSGMTHSADSVLSYLRTSRDASLAREPCLASEKAGLEALVSALHTCALRVAGAVQSMTSHGHEHLHIDLLQAGSVWPALGPRAKQPGFACAYLAPQGSCNSPDKLCTRTESI